MPWILPDQTPPAPPAPPSGGGASPGPIVLGATGSPGPLDPYGTDLAFDPSGDLRVTHSGSVGTVNGAYNCAQAVFLRLKTPLGDLALHPDYGSQLAGRDIGGKMNVAGLTQQLNSELQTLLATDARFQSAQVAAVQQPANANAPDSIQLSVRATLAGGEQLVLGNVADPTPSDVSIPLIVDPSLDPTLTWDPLTQQEFTADQTEFDTLNDLSQQQWLAVNQPNASVLGTGG